jgi:dihydroxyacetone kinase phosphoprotein-dependent L subunit
MEGSHLSTYELSVDQVKGMLLQVCQAVIGSKELLSQADRDIGDGDHGIGMALGFSSAKDALSTEELDDVYTVFASVGRTLIRVMGGASGIIFGLLFFAGSKNREPKNYLTIEDFQGIFEVALEEIQNKGGARVGDKTMIDALHPMVESIRDSVSERLPFEQLLEKASKSARRGMEDSKQYVAKLGKAKTLGERAIGFPDPGAVSLAIIADAMHQWAVENL